MNPRDFVYKEIYKEALKAKASPKSASDFAAQGMKEYDQGKIPKGGVTTLIQQKITQAKKVK